MFRKEFQVTSLLVETHRNGSGRWLAVSLVVLLSMLVSSSVAHAATIAQFGFGTNAGTSTLNPTTTGTNLQSVTALASGGGLGTFTSNWGISTSSGNPINGLFIRSDVTDGAADDYLAFTVTAANGYMLNLSELKLDILYQAANTFSATWAIRSSVDGYAGDVASYTRVGSGIANTTDYITGSPAANLSGASFQNLSDITFRVYVTDTSTDLNHITRLDNITLTGDVALAPEPASLGTGLLLACGAMLTRRRRR
jgi:hypothetical protein